MTGFAISRVISENENEHVRRSIFRHLIARHRVLFTSSAQIWTILRPREHINLAVYQIAICSVKCELQIAQRAARQEHGSSIFRENARPNRNSAEPSNPVSFQNVPGHATHQSPLWLAMLWLVNFEATLAEGSACGSELISFEASRVSESSVALARDRESWRHYLHRSDVIAVSLALCSSSA